jgi:hypothetical protein
VTALTIAVYAVLLAAAAAAVWRLPIVALYLFIAGLALHNLVMALLFDAGLDGAWLDAVQDGRRLCGVAAASVATDATASADCRPHTVDWLALAPRRSSRVIPNVRSRCRREAILYGSPRARAFVVYFSAAHCSAGELRRSAGRCSPRRRPPSAAGRPLRGDVEQGAARAVEYYRDELASTPRPGGCLTTGVQH